MNRMQYYFPIYHISVYTTISILYVASQRDLKENQFVIQ